MSSAVDSTAQSNVNPDIATQSLKDGISGNPNIAANNAKVTIDNAGQPVVKAVDFNTTAPVGRNNNTGSSTADLAKSTVEEKANVAANTRLRPLVADNGKSNKVAVTPQPDKVAKNTPKAQVAQNTKSGNKDRGSSKNTNRATANKGQVVKNTRPRQRQRSNARLVGESKLKPVGSEVVKNTSRRQPRNSRTNRHNKREQAKIVASERKQIVAAKKAGAKERIAKNRSVTSKNRSVTSKNRSVTSKNRSVTSKNRSVASKTKVATTSPAGRNKFAVQLLATSSSKKAKTLRSTFKNEGYNAYISNTSRGGKKLYRVRVTANGSKSSATKKLTSMKRRYKQNKYIQSGMVVKL